MCILIASEYGSLPTLEQLAECERNNPHGIGISWVEGGQIVTARSMSLEGLLPDLDRKPEHAPYILHFRYATHGERTLENCHPFTIGKTHSVAHNGILPWRSCPKRSDTRNFVHDLLRPNRKELENPDFISHIEEFIGPWNKIAILNNYGEITILNEREGFFDGEIWFSNCGYRPRETKKTKTDFSHIFKTHSAESPF